jgi:hypothetical protein
MLPTWYLSVDFQLVLLSPLIIYPAYKWGWKFLWLLPVYIIAIQIWTFVAAIANGYKPVRFFLYGLQLFYFLFCNESFFSIICRNFDNALESAVKFYFTTHIRLSMKLNFLVDIMIFNLIEWDHGLWELFWVMFSLNSKTEKLQSTR